MNEGNLWSKTRDDTESGNKSDENSTLPQLISEEEIYEISSVDEYDSEPMSTDMLEDFSDGSKSHPSINRRDARYKIRDCFKRGQAEWKISLLSTQNIGKGLHKIFKDVVNDIFHVVPI